MSPGDLLFLYRARLRARTVLVQEALAILGIAVGVALLFASQVASTSLTGSFSRLVDQTIGHTHALQLEARGPDGFGEHVLGQARRLPGVRLAFPVLEVQASLVGPRASEPVYLFGVDPRLDRAGGALLKRYSAAQLATQQAIALPAALAAQIGVGSLEVLRIDIGGRSTATVLANALGERELGGLGHSPIALTNVAYAQRLSGLHGRLTNVFVQAAPGHAAQVKAELARIAPSAAANLEPADHDIKLFEVAAAPATQAERLFSAISALVAFLFALNAMLVTVPARRRLIGEVRVNGATRRIALQIVLFDAAVLAALGGALGIGLGDVLSMAVYNGTPNYLSFAFPIGNARIVDWQSIALAVGAGAVAALIGVLWPLRDMVAGDAFMDPRPQRASGRARAPMLPLAGAALFAATAAILVFDPGYAVLGSVTLVGALLCMLPLVFDRVVSGFARIARLSGSASAVLAATQLQTPRTRIRSLAIAATAAVAVFGVVEFGGAEANLQRGVDSSARAIDANAAVWVSAAGEANNFATVPLRLAAARLSGQPGVAAVSAYRGGFLNWGRRRLWVLAPPASAPQPVPPGQLRVGSLAQADAHVRDGGWAVLSEALAAEHRLRIGEAFMLPSPRPTALRVAAISSNLAWPSGAILMSSAQYARAFAARAATAYWVTPRARVSAVAVRAALRRALGPGSGVTVETASERERGHYARLSQTLSRLTQIRLLLLFAAVLAVAGTMAAIVWQRRELVAFIKCDGYRRGVLWRWLCLENALLIVVGTASGAAMGLFGQLLATHFMASTTGFPVSYDAQLLSALVSFAALSLIAVSIIALPGFVVASTPPSTVRPAY